MSLIAPLNKQEAIPEVRATLENFEEEFGMIPNGIAVLAKSKTSLDLMVKMEDILGKGEITKRQREMIALAVSQANSCRYCLSAHTEFCSTIGLEYTDIIRSRLGEADDPKDQAMLDLAVAIVENKGEVPEEQIEGARSVGLTDSFILEIASNVIGSIFGNYVNHLAKTEIDFPLCKMDL